MPFFYLRISALKQAPLYTKVYPLTHPMSNTACAKGSALVSIHCLSSKENEENTDQAMPINGARSPRWRTRRKHQWKTSVTRQWQKHCNLTACLCLGRQQSTRSAARSRLARGSAQAGCGNSGDDPRAGER